MAKNILIFSDGTGEAGGLTPDENVSNIYKLFRATRCGPDSDIDPRDQLTFYDPGLGSQPETGVFGAERAYRWAYNLVSQATGLGITKNIVDCYAAILQLWQPGDRVFLFGFSRGAYSSSTKFWLCTMNHKCKWLASYPQAKDDGAPILVPARTRETYGDHLRHLAGHAGTIPLSLDEFGRCIVCLGLGCFRLNA